MHRIPKPPPFEETMAALRNAPPPGEYSRVETEKRRALQRGIDRAFRQPDEVRPSRFWGGPPKVKKKKRSRTQRSALSPRAFLGKPCAYCERPMLGVRFPTRDHVYPRALGGRSKPDNIFIVCSPCNGNKGDRTLEQFATFLTAHGDQRASIVWKLLDREEPPRAMPPRSSDADETRRIVAGWEAARRKADSTQL